MASLENKNVYVGNRYVPKIFGEWNSENTYEGLSIVTHQGASYTSKQYVPVGIDISNTEFWVVTGNYNAQVENYRQEVLVNKQVLDNALIQSESSEKYASLNDKIIATNTMIDISLMLAKTNSLSQTLKTLVTSNRTIYFPKGTYTLDAETVIENVDNIQLVFHPEAVFKDSHANQVMTTNGTYESLPNGLHFKNVNGLKIKGLKTDFPKTLKSYKVIEADISKRKPNFDFTNVSHIEIDDIIINGYVGAYVLGTAYQTMAAAFFRFYECKDIKISNPTLNENSGDGEIFNFYQCDQVVFDNPHHDQVSESQKTFWSLGKFIQCTNYIIKNIVDVRSWSTGNMFDVSGSFGYTDNLNAYYPKGDYIDVTFEWDMYSGNTNNFKMSNAAYFGNGERGLMSIVAATKDRLNVHTNLSIDHIYLEHVQVENADYIFNGNEALNVSYKDVIAKNVKRLNYLEKLSDESDKDVYYLFDNIRATSNLTEWTHLETFGETKVVNSSFKDISLYLPDRKASRKNILIENSDAKIIFENVTFKNVTFNILANIEFIDCYFENCTFKTVNYILGKPSIKFYQSILEYKQLAANKQPFYFMDGSTKEILFDNTKLIGTWVNTNGSIFFTRKQDDAINFTALNSSFDVKRLNSDLLLNTTGNSILGNVANDKYVTIKIDNTMLNMNIATFLSSTTVTSGKVYVLLKDSILKRTNQLYNNAGGSNSFANFKVITMNTIEIGASLDDALTFITTNGGTVNKSNNIKNVSIIE